LPWEFEYLQESRVLSVRVTGTVDMASWENQLRTSVEEASKHSCLRYLVDYRKSSMALSVADLYERPKYYSKVGMPHHARIALLIVEPGREKDFVESVTSNRGFLVRVFDEREPALQWLTRGDRV
jgi:hypothetical protein